MSLKDKIRWSYPLPIAKLYEAMDLETEPRQRVLKLVDLFEGISSYLTLVGLATCLYHGLSDRKMEKLRSRLRRPSLGVWISLLRSVDRELQSSDIASLFPDPDKVYRKDAIFEVNQILVEITGVKQRKKVQLAQFLESVVQFRNKKIAHGHLLLHEAQKVCTLLESAINQWLEELPILHQQHLIYINPVEWQSPHFVCFGTNLNSGVSLSPFKSARDEPVTHGQVYLEQPASGYLIPLYPLFVFEKHYQLLYICAGFSDKQELILRCPYEAPGTEAAPPTPIPWEPECVRERQDRPDVLETKPGLNVNLLEKTLDSLLPASNKRDNESYADLLEDLIQFQVNTQQDLRTLIEKRLDAALAVDSQTIKGISGDFKDEYKYLEARVQRRVLFSHVGLVRGILRQEFDDEFEKYMKKRSEFRTM